MSHVPHQPSGGEEQYSSSMSDLSSFPKLNGKIITINFNTVALRVCTHPHSSKAVRYEALFEPNTTCIYFYAMESTVRV